MAQLTYGKQGFHPALAGQAELSQPHNIVAASCSATGVIQFGQLVEIDPAAQVFAVKAYDGAGTVHGVCVLDETKMKNSAGVAEYVSGELLSVMRSGRIWLKVAAAVTLGTAHASIPASFALKNATAPNGDFLALYELNIP